MKTLFTLVAISIAFQLFAQQKIADVRNLGVGATATISGIVTNGDELGAVRYVQDSTAGLAIYDSKLSNVERGDSISVTGEIHPFYNLFEITKISNLTVHSSGNPLPSPVILSIDDIGERYEGQLIQINNVEISGASGIFTGNKNYDFTDGQNTGTLRINTNTPIVGQTIPGGKFNLIAICSQYSFNPNDEQTGYQLLPRNMDDFISGSAVNFTTPVAVKNISKTGLTLTWNTDVDASSEVNFGTSPDKAALTNSASGSSTPADGEFLHEVTLTGLTPGTIIYARSFSVLASDTASSSVLAFATQSNSTGSIKVYFNTNVDNSLSTGINAINIGNAVEDTLIAYFNRAVESIDFCIYNINNNGLSNVSEALNAAYNRGVKVRVISGGTTAHSGTDDLLPAVPYLEAPESNQRDGLMHNKFAVIDANSSNPDIPVLWTGSSNITYDQIQTDANNIAFIQDQSLAKAYQIEFEEMWGSTGNTPSEANAKFGAQKANNTPHEFVVGGKRIECYFSPSDGTNQHLINSINTADNDLDIETMLITRSDIANAIKDAKERGVEVHVITNAAGGNSSTVNSILNSVLPATKFIQDQTGKGTLHNKLAIIDGNSATSDPQVITGSHNWSNSANDKNDENTLIIHNADIANQYLQQFAYRFAENGGELVVSAGRIEIEKMKVYPNPATKQIKIETSVPLSKVSLFSLNGRKISEKIINSKPTAVINLAKIESGIYLLSVRDMHGNVNTYKVVKSTLK